MVNSTNNAYARCPIRPLNGNWLFAAPYLRFTGVAMTYARTHTHAYKSERVRETESPHRKHTTTHTLVHAHTVMYGKTSRLPKWKIVRAFFLFSFFHGSESKVKLAAAHVT